MYRNSPSSKCIFTNALHLAAYITLYIFTECNLTDWEAINLFSPDPIQEMEKKIRADVFANAKFLLAQLPSFNIYVELGQTGKRSTALCDYVHHNLRSKLRGRYRTNLCLKNVKLYSYYKLLVLYIIAKLLYTWKFVAIFNPLVPRVQKMQISKRALTDFYWVNL